MSTLIPPTDQPIGQTADGKQPLTTEDHALLPTSTTGGARPRSPHQAVGTSAAPYAPIYQPANQDADAMPLIGPYHRRGYQVGPENLLAPLTNLDELDELPPTFRPWWDAELSEPMRQTEHPQEVDVDRLVVGALQFAPRVMSLRADPQVRATYLAEYCADFDWRAFLETRVDDLNDPVGNTLTTGGPRRFKDLNLSTKGGLRRRTESGGEFEISQRAGWEDTNSIFFVPKTQGTARLQMNYTQPLLNGAGEAYNRSRIVLARIDANRSFDETAAELQDHLLKVAEAYWELYRTRAIFLQRDKVLAGAEDILETLGARQEVDALPRQVLRARAAVASRRSEIIRSAASIRNAESHLRLLVNDPAWQEAGGVELIPTESPLNTHVALTLSGATQTALQNRPDVSHAIRDLRAAGLRLGVAKQDLLPKLDLVLSAYVAGLNGESAIGRSLGDQFGKGRPGYSTGLVFEVPLGNRAASARAERREWELNKAMNDFRTIVETGLTDVEISVREVETSYREMLSRYQSLLAAEHEAAYLDDRWRTLPGDDRGTTLLLEDLLTAQSRVAEAEADFVTAKVAYTVALLRSQRATGTLLKAE